MKILFANPVFEWDTPNVTCRRPSLKYLQNLSLDSGISLANLEEDVCGYGTVKLLALYDSVNDIPQYLLDMEHDPSCHTSEGLLAELNRVYGEYGDDEPVLVIQFIPRPRC